MTFSALKAAYHQTMFHTIPETTTMANESKLSREQTPYIDQHIFSHSPLFATKEDSKGILAGETVQTPASTIFQTRTVITKLELPPLGAL
jgi:hypothetical protein